MRAFANAKNVSVYAIFNDQSFNDTLTNDIISFEKLGPDGPYCAAASENYSRSEKQPCLNVEEVL